MATFNGRLGRQSEQLYNEELHRLYKLIEHLGANPDNTAIGPEANVSPISHGALWLNTKDESLNYYDKEERAWKTIFNDTLSLIRHIADPLPPGSAPLNEEEPVRPPKIGTLHIHNGVLMWYTGKALNGGWEPVRALAQDALDMNLSAFLDFVQISHDLENIGTLNDGGTAKKVFVVPDMRLDRHYQNRELLNDYEPSNVVSFYYPENQAMGNTFSTVHVNPSRLKNVNKYLVKTDGEEVIHRLENCEYFGLDTQNGVTQYLRENTDYKKISQSAHAGIRFLGTASQDYDYLLIVEYEFGWFRKSGRLVRDTYSLDVSAFVHTTARFSRDYLLTPSVFVQGLNLEQDYYTFEHSNGTVLIVDGADQINDIDAFNTARKEYGIIRHQEGHEEIRIYPYLDYRSPMIIVNGIVYGVVKPEHFKTDEKGATYIGIQKDDDILNMTYAIIETAPDEGDREKLNVPLLNDGIIGADQRIVFSDTSDPAIQQKIRDKHFLLFVNGVLINNDDVLIDEIDYSLRCLDHSFAAGMDAIVFLEEGALQRIRSEFVPAYVIDTNARYDRSLVFADNKLINDNTPVVQALGETPREFFQCADKKGKIENRVFVDEHGQYMLYKSQLHEYNQPMEETEQQALQQMLGKYVESNKRIILLDTDLAGQTINYWGYNTASTIERNLLVGTRKISGHETVHSVPPYIIGKESLSVYLNGLRVYPDHIEEIPDYHTNRSSQFSFVGDLGDTNQFEMTYLVEPLEHLECETCKREVYDQQHIPAASRNVIDTRLKDGTPLNLFPGFVTVYVGGIRQSCKTYAIIDNYHIMFNDFLTLPNESLQDEVLIEVRNDFWLKETVLKVEEEGKFEFGIEDGIPPEMFDSQDFIKIYVDGVFVGSRYFIHKQRQTIVVTNMAIAKSIAKKRRWAPDEPVATEIIFEWR